LLEFLSRASAVEQARNTILHSEFTGVTDGSILRNKHRVDFGKGFNHALDYISTEQIMQVAQDIESVYDDLWSFWQPIRETLSVLRLKALGDEDRIWIC
jgi:hypothetical protein